MSSHIDTSSIDEKDVKEVVAVADFAVRYRLADDEKVRLTKLFGIFATKQELLMNARRSPR
jgi:nucleoid DNA-binding protein